MSVTADILRTYRAPRQVLRDRIGPRAREDRALATLVAACVLIFVAQWPRLAREAHLDPAIGLDQRLASALYGWLFLAPLAFYALSILVVLGLRVAGTGASGYAVRMALFWGLLAASPLFLATGLAAGPGAGAAPALTGIAALVALVVFWGAGLAEAVRTGQGGRA